MGCLFGFLASAVAAGLAWLAHGLGASTAVLVAIVVVTCLLFAIPVLRYGHVGFGKAGPIDLKLYLIAIGVVTALVLPRLVRSKACDTVQRHAAWLWSAEQSYHAEHQRYTIDVRTLHAVVGYPEDFQRDFDVQLRVERATDSTFVAIASHDGCRSGAIRVDESWRPPETDGGK